MSTQIAVRLPDGLVDFVDEIVKRGDATSRAAVVSQALERERRRQIAERDAAILARERADESFDDLAAHAARIALEGLD